MHHQSVDGSIPKLHPDEINIQKNPAKNITMIITAIL